jgi:hypothetical protein
MLKQNRHQDGMGYEWPGYHHTGGIVKSNVRKHLIEDFPILPIQQRHERSPLYSLDFCSDSKGWDSSTHRRCTRTDRFKGDRT